MIMKGGECFMASFIARQIIKGKVDYSYVFSIERYKEHQDDVDEILIMEGKQDLIVR